MSNRASPSPGNEFLFSLGGLLKRFKLTTENFKDQEILTLANLDNGYRRKFIVKKVDERSLFGRRGSKGSRSSRSSRSSQKSTKDGKSDKGSRSGSLKKKKEKKNKPEDKKDGKRRLSTSSIYSIKSACSLKSFGRQKHLGSQTSLNSQKSTTSEKTLNKKNSFGSGKFKIGCGSSSESDDEVFEAFATTMTANDKEEKDDPGFVNPALVKEDFEDEGIGGLDKEDEGVEVLDLDKDEKDDRDEKDDVTSKRSDGDGSSETGSLNSLDSNMSGPRFNITSSPRPTRRGSKKRHQQPSPVCIRRDCQSNRSSVSSQARKGILKKTHSSTTINMEMSNISRPETPTENGHTSKSTESLEDTYSNGDGSRFVRAGHGDNVHLNHQRSFNRVKFILDSGKPDNIIGDYGDYDDIKIEKIERERNERIERDKTANATTTNGLSRSGKKCLIFTAGLLVLTMAVILGSFFGSRKSGLPTKAASYNKFIVGALEGKFRITNEDFDAQLLKSETKKFKKLSKLLEDSMVKAIFIEESANQANSSIKLRVVQYEEGSVISTFRIKWDEKLALNLIEIRKRIQRHLDKYGAFGDYKIDKSSFTISEQRDLCVGNPQSCEHICALSDETLQFGCTCPYFLILHNNTHCVSPKLAVTTAKNPVFIPGIINQVLKISNAELWAVNQETVSKESPQSHAEEKPVVTVEAANATLAVKNATATEAGHTNSTVEKTSEETKSSDSDDKSIATIEKPTEAVIDIPESEKSILGTNATSNATDNNSTSIQHPTTHLHAGENATNVTEKDHPEGTTKQPSPLVELKDNLTTYTSVETVTEKIPERTTNQNDTTPDVQLPAVAITTEKSTKVEVNTEINDEQSVTDQLTTKEEPHIEGTSAEKGSHLANEENTEDSIKASGTEEPSRQIDETPEQPMEKSNITQELPKEEKEPDKNEKDVNGTKEQITQSLKPDKAHVHAMENVTIHPEHAVESEVKIPVSEPIESEKEVITKPDDHHEPPSVLQLVTMKGIHNDSSDATPSSVEIVKIPAPIVGEQLPTINESSPINSSTGEEKLKTKVEETKVETGSNNSDTENIQVDEAMKTGNESESDKSLVTDKVDEPTNEENNLLGTSNVSSIVKDIKDSNISHATTENTVEIPLKDTEKDIGSDTNKILLPTPMPKNENVTSHLNVEEEPVDKHPTSEIEKVETLNSKPSKETVDIKPPEASSPSIVTSTDSTKKIEIKVDQSQLSVNIPAESIDTEGASMQDNKVGIEDSMNNASNSQQTDESKKTSMVHQEDSLMTATLIPEMFLTLDPNINEVSESKIRDKNNSFDEHFLKNSKTTVTTTNINEIENKSTNFTLPTTVIDYVLSSNKSIAANAPITAVVLNETQVDQVQLTTNSSFGFTHSKDESVSHQNDSQTSEMHLDLHPHSPIMSGENETTENNFHIPLPVLRKESSTDNPKRVIILLPSEDPTKDNNNNATMSSQIGNEHPKKIVTIQGIPLEDVAPSIRDKIPLAIFQTSHLYGSTQSLHENIPTQKHQETEGKTQSQPALIEENNGPIDFGLIANVSHDLSFPSPINTHDIAQESPAYVISNATLSNTSVITDDSLSVISNLSNASSTTMAPELICKEDEFKCINGNGVPGMCIPKMSRCDSIFDCADHSDEQECVANKCIDNFQCRWSGDCLERKFVCDGIKHCTDGDDEEGCETMTCKSDEYRCDVGTYASCIPLSYKCDGQPDCFNHTEEFNCSLECKKDHFLCKEGMCIPNSWKCDGKNDCTGGEDEADCGCEGLDQSPCAVGGCVPTFKLCDGLRQCPDGSDEWGCLRIDNSSKQLQVRSSGGRWSVVCGDKWTSQWTDLVCEQIGFGVSLSTEVRRVNESVPRPRVKLSPDATEVSRRGRAPLQYLLTQGDCPTDPLVHISCNMPQCGSWPVDTPDVAILRQKTEEDVWPSLGLLIQPEKYNDETVAYKYACAASIITPVWVIASYSCLESKTNGFEAENWAFMSGNAVSNAGGILDTHLRHAKLMVPYPGAKRIGGLWVGDAVLLRLQRPLKFDDSTKPICLSDEPSTSHEQCVIAAWKSNKNGMEEGRRQLVQNLPVPNLTVNTCNTSYYEGRLKQGHACASFLQDKHSPCSGNEGSPLMCKKKDGSWYLHGLLSHTGKCASFNLPSVFTDVGSINSWILRTIGRPIQSKDSRITTTTVTTTSSTTPTTNIDVDNAGNAVVDSSLEPPVVGNEDIVQPLNTPLNNGSNTTSSPLIHNENNNHTS